MWRRVVILICVCYKVENSHNNSSDMSLNDDLNYYAILGLDSNATQESIKKAYKKLALKHHPDKGGDLEKFHLITKAYNVLKQSEIKPKSSNIHLNIKLTLQDILKNKVFTVNPKRIVGCNYCCGQGHINFSFVNCILCDGHGEFNSIMGIPILCVHCRGTGKISIECPKRKCPKCNGQKYIEKSQTLFVSSFHCVEHSLRHPDKPPIIVFYGKGNLLPNKPPGDLVIHFIEQPDPNFKRDQLDIVYTKYLTLYDAFYGLTFDLKFITGKYYRITLKPLLELNSTLDSTWFNQIIEGIGIQSPNKHSNGNLVINFKLIIPDISNNKETLQKMFLSSQKKLLENKSIQKVKLKTV
jgi:DnaJ family protein A protein 2